MKFFYKMFLGMTVILAVALGMIEYVTLSYSLEHAVKREQDSALSQHQMIKYSIETVILNMKSEDVDKELTDMMSQSAKSIVGDEGGMYLAAAVALDDGIDNTISDYFVTSDISKELSAWIFIISFEDTRMLAAVDAVLGVPFYITYYCADVDSPKAQAAVMRDLYAKTYGSDYSMGDPKESESKIDSSFETNIIENFYYGNNYT